MAKINITSFKKALKDSGGVQARIAERLQIGRSTVHDFLNKNPKMRKLLNQEAEQILDIAEDNINLDIATRKDVDSSKWKLLHSKGGRARGYGQKTEIEHSGETQPNTFNLIVKSVEEIKSEKLDNQPKAT